MTTSVYMLRVIVDALRRAGVEPEPVLAEVGLTLAALLDLDLRVPYRTTLRLWERAVALTGDPDLGLHAAELTRLGTFDVLDYALYSSPTLGSALRRAVRYFRLITGAARLELEADGDCLWVIHHTASEHRPWPRQSSEFTLACVVVYGRRTTATDWAPRQVTFTHERPQDVREHERLFRAPLAFGQPTTGLAIDRSLLPTPLVHADPRLLNILERHADGLLERIPGQSGSISDRVREHLATSLRGTVPSVADTAEALGLGERTLQRRLHEEGATHQVLIDEVRQQLAYRYLEETGLPIGEVAYLLGFSEPSAFHRAFRRWAGTTPADYRRQVTS